MWHTCDAMHNTNLVFHLYLFNTVHVLLQLAQSFVGLVPVRTSSVNCTLPLKVGGDVLSMSELHGLCDNY